MSVELGLQNLYFNNKESVLPPPSDEQQEIISCFLRGFNIKAEAVARTRILNDINFAQQKKNGRKMCRKYLIKKLKNSNASTLMLPNLE